MEMQPFIDFIHKNVPNIMVKPDHLQLIAKNFEKIHFNRNDYFLKEGKVSGYMYLESGFMRAFSLYTEVNEVTTFFDGSNRAVFDVSSFFLRSPTEENIQAVTECVGYITNFEKLNGLFHSIPEFREFGRQMLVNPAADVQPILAVHARVTVGFNVARGGRQSREKGDQHQGHR